jgi:hypothetical protein
MDYPYDVSISFNFDFFLLVFCKFGDFFVVVFFVICLICAVGLWAIKVVFVLFYEQDSGG